MTDTFSPPVWRRRVANELRRLREAAGRSQRDAAQHLGCRVPKISLIEGGQRNIKIEDLTSLLEFYKVPEDEHDYYVAATRRSQGKAWWDGYEEGVLVDGFERYLSLEQGAHRIRAFTPTVVHGLLQTPDYATAVFHQHPSQPSDELIRRRVALRQRRARVLTREVDPLRFTCLMDESVLLRRIGDRSVMAEQLLHIARLLREHPNLRVQVILFSRGVPWMDFAILSFPWPDDPGVVYIEHFAGSVYLDSLAEVDAHTQAFHRFQEQAMSPDASLELIESTAARYADPDTYPD